MTGICINSGVPAPNGRAISRVDRGIIPGMGDYYLFDAGHSQQGLTSIPANGATIKNLARLECAKMLGLTSSSADLASCDLTFSRGAGTHHALALTTKGGMHFNINSTGDTSADYAYFDASAAIKAHVFNNTTEPPTYTGDHIAHSIWMVQHRVGLSSVALMGIYTISGGRSFEILLQDNTNPATTWPTVDGALNASTSPTLNTPTMRSMGVKSWVNTSYKPSVSTDITMSFGLKTPAYTTVLNKSGVFTIYRARITNLTKAGITYAQFEAIEAALMLEAFSAPGTVITLSALAAAFFGVTSIKASGRYYNDSGFPTILA